ncbi:MAG: hypothetical protein E7Z76_00240 [Methanobrevibacter sp.]|nr:hypothetical protein [Methanobrevibacter sp.]
MKIKEGLIIICVIFILFSITSVSAGDVNTTTITSSDDTQIVENTDDEIITSSQKEIVNTNPGTFEELQHVINLAPTGSTITLDKDYTYSGKLNKFGIILTKDITIDGNGHTLNGLSQSRIFMINFGKIINTQVVLKNINFINGKTELYGGAIFNYGNLIVKNCTFTNNYAKYCGGAINSVGHLQVKDSIFNGNTADGDGGAILCLSPAGAVQIYNNYYQNQTVIGDMEFILPILMNIEIKFLTESIMDCTFKNNKANGRGGGAIYAFGNIDINSSTFSSNQAGEMGGAVFGNKDLYIHNSIFTKNTALKNGGAVYFKCHEQSGKYVGGKWVSDIKYYSNLIENSKFTKNTANKGGAIYGFVTSKSDKVHCAKAQNCVFSKNSATTSGRDTYGTVTTNCLFDYYALSLKTIKVKKSAKKLTLKAKLKKGNTLINKAKIKFKFNGITYKAKTNKKGIAKATVKKSVLKNLNVGEKVKYQASYKTLVVKKTCKVKK